MDLPSLTKLLEDNGFIAAAEEAQELLAYASAQSAAASSDSAGASTPGATGDSAGAAAAIASAPGATGDSAEAILEAAVRRRLTGEPLAWITGSAPFCGLTVVVAPGVYVPRWQTELLAERGRELLGATATAIDLCTGCGAVAAVLATTGARVLATDVEPAAVACAVANGVEAHAGDLFAPLHPALHGTVDLVTGVVPYVPTPELHLLQRDTFTFETPTSYDGGPDGCAILRRAIAGAATFLRPGGTLLLELGGDEAALIAPDLAAAGFSASHLLLDEDGDLRGIEATLPA